MSPHVFLALPFIPIISESYFEDCRTYTVQWFEQPNADRRGRGRAGPARSDNGHGLTTFKYVESKQRAVIAQKSIILAFEKLKADGRVPVAVVRRIFNIVMAGIEDDSIPPPRNEDYEELSDADASDAEPAAAELRLEDEEESAED
jgi:hypothetical protein